MQAITHARRARVMLGLGCSAGRLLLAATLLAFAAGRGSAQVTMICDQPFDGDLVAFAERIRQLPHAEPPKKDKLGLMATSVWPLEALRDGGPGSADWSFTTADHPAHPSVVCWRIVNTGGRFNLQNQFHCQAAKVACDKLAAEASALEQFLRQSLDALWEYERHKRAPLP
jgi:hypothetical protein